MAKSLTFIDSDFSKTAKTMEDISLACTTTLKSLKGLIQMRGAKRGSATKCLRLLNEKGASLSLEDCTFYRNKLTTLKHELLEFDNKIDLQALEEEVYTSEQYGSQADLSDQYQDKINRAIQFLDGFLSLSHSNDGNSLQSVGESCSYTKAKLPVVELPFFSGGSDDFEKFMSIFESMISKHKLSSFEKYTYLKTQLKGSARVLIESLPLDDLTYESAKKLLAEAFSDKLSQQYVVIKKLVDLKLSYETDPFAWISSLRTIVEQFDRLKITVEILIQYFAWNSLNDKFKNQYTLITNKSKPSLKEIQDLAFEANNRYQVVNERFKKFNQNKVGTKNKIENVIKTTSYALNVPSNTFNFKPCRLCRKEGEQLPDHSISRCNVYPMNEDKVERVKELGGCLKCSSLSHCTKKCETKLNTKCKTCSGWHVHFLCVTKGSVGKHRNKKGNVTKGTENERKEKNSAESKIESESGGCESGVIWVSVNHVNIGNDELLPTFTSVVQLKKGESMKASCLLDTGSQLSFIQTHLAERCGFEIINPKLTLKVNGFNSESTYVTRSVLVEMDFGDHHLKFIAVCVPEIRTKIRISRLKQVADKLKSKGYNLTDSNLGCGGVRDLKFIMGTKDMHLLPMTMSRFGRDHSTLCFQTTQGLMLLGSVIDILKNIKYLPHASESKEGQTFFQENVDLHSGGTDLRSGGTDLLLGDFNWSSGSSDLHLGDSNLALGGSDLRSGDSDLRSGDSDLRSGDSDLRSGDSDLRSGDSDLLLDDSDLLLGDSDLASGSSDLTSGSSDLRSGETDLRSGETDLRSGGTDLVSGGSDSRSSNYDSRSDGFDLCPCNSHLDFGSTIDGDRFGESKFASLERASYGGECFNSAYLVLNEKNEVIESEIKNATDDILNLVCSTYLNLDAGFVERENSELNINLCDFMMENISRDKSGRLVVPLPWNPQVKHLMSRNFKLALKILETNVKKLSRNEGRLEAYNEVIVNQKKEGIIEEISDLDNFLKENPSGISFMAHNGVFRPDHQSTKVRVVFLSNLSEKSGTASLSHNQCSLVGANLNQKLSTALLLLRFDRWLITYDLKKAFLQLMVRPQDTNRLLFLWYKDVLNGGRKLTAFRMLRLPFGMRFSPFVLMCALHTILIDGREDENKEIKRGLYDLAYMDNISWTTNEEGELEKAYNCSKNIFSSYGFELQQFETNSVVVQSKIDSELDNKSEEECKLFGMIWTKGKDTLKTNALRLDIYANTKRLMLRSLHSIFDIYGIFLPVLNRARLFIHRLQCDKNLSWDHPVSEDLQREWSNVAKQVNSTPEIGLERSCGPRNGKYELICFTDASKSLYGCVLYIKDLHSNKVSFLCAKNKVINKQMSSKTIPTLELVGIHLGVQLLIETYSELHAAVRPIEIQSLKLFTDSQVCLAWLQSSILKLDKMQRLTVFVLNRLDAINKLCETHTVVFYHVQGVINPADQVTREVSGKVLLKSNFYKGPKMLESIKDEQEQTLLIPNPLALKVDVVTTNLTSPPLQHEPLFPLDRFSSFNKALAVTRVVLKFCNILKAKMRARNPNAKLGFLVRDDENLHRLASTVLLRQAQHSNFKEVFEFFDGQLISKVAVPELVTKLNVVLDRDGLLRVKSKMSASNKGDNYPLLLGKFCPLTKAIVWDCHRATSHSGVYSVLNCLRKEFWIVNYYSVVRKIIKSCVFCKRQNARTTKTNQNVYKDFRVDPGKVPFSFVMIDHMGPFKVKKFGCQDKVYILIVTCLFSRAVSLLVCQKADTKSFLKAFQIHVLRYGIPSLIVSDPGTSLVAGMNVVVEFLSDIETQEYLNEKNIKLQYNTYPSGASWLGGLVETMVKQCKKLLYHSLHNNVLDYFDFEFIVIQTELMVNQRPIALKRNLTCGEPNGLVLTPELIVKGYTTNACNILPHLQSSPTLADRDNIWEADNDYCIGPKGLLSEGYDKLRKVRNRLRDLYHEEFLANLVEQATDRKGRYAKLHHEKLQVGDLVSIKLPFHKPIQYPLGVVKTVEINDLGESVTATVLKGNGHVVRKHSNDLILLLRSESEEETSTKQGERSSTPARKNEEIQTSTRPQRKAKVKAKKRIRTIADS